MIYCMSDIHGEVDRFNEMLKLINSLEVKKDEEADEN